MKIEALRSWLLFPAVQRIVVCNRLWEVFIEIEAKIFLHFEAKKSARRREMMIGGKRRSGENFSPSLIDRPFRSDRYTIN